MGSGKSTVGEALAELLGWKLVDLDREIVKREGCSIAEIFQSQGEPHFRKIESDVLEQSLRQSRGEVVIALGGGTFIQPCNRELLRQYQAVTVYLDADFDLLLSRCCNDEATRPLLADPERSRRLFEERQPVYQLADSIVQVEGRAPREIAKEIASIIRKRAKPAVSE